MLRWAVVLWLGATLVPCIRIALQEPGRNSNYVIFADAGRDWRAGRDLYLTPHPHDWFLYSPPIAACLAPLSCLPDQAGEVLWRMANCAALLAGLFGWAKVQDLDQSRIAVVLFLVWPASAANLNNAQSNPLLLGLMLTATACAARQRWTWAAILTAAASWLKVYPIALALLFCLLEPRRFAGRFVLALLGVGMALPFACQRPDFVLSQFASWSECLARRGDLPWPDWLLFRNFRLLLHVWGWTLDARRFQAIQLAAAFGVAALVWGGRQRLHALQAFDLACCWMTVFGSATESSTYLLLMPSLALALTRSPQAIAPVRVALGVSYGLFLICHAAAWFPFARAFHSLGLQPLAGCIFTVIVAASAWRTAHLSSNSLLVPSHPVLGVEQSAAA